jgi:hypothetical protein
MDVGARRAARVDGASGGEFFIEPKPPCYFIHDEPGVAPVLAYADFGIEALAVVVGTAIPAEDREFRKAPADAACGSELQGLLIESGKPMPSKLVLRNSVGAVTWVCTE